MDYDDYTDVAAGVAGGVGAAASALSNASNLFNSINGFLPRAILFVPTNKSMSLAEANDLAGMGNDVAALRALVTGRGKSSLTGGSQLPGQVVESSVVTGQQVAAKTTYMEIAASMGASGYVAMEVQYNPSSISLNNSAGPIINTNAGGDMGVMAGQMLGDGTRSSLSVQLVFDDVNVMDAYLQEGVNLSVESGVDYAKYIARMATGGFSVQTPCEGLLSLLHFRKLRQVVFFWSEMFFHGDLDMVNVNYTMFNKLGHPVRAVVDLLIRQSDTKDLYESDNLAWQEAYEKTFKEGMF